MLLVRRCIALVLLAGLCLLPRQIADAQTPAVITFLHFNDVYEIEAADGGLSRVATLLGRMRRTRPPVIATLGGDYLSPSAIGTAVVDGEPLWGRQMVDVLNAVGIDWATFGNHEFDVPEETFNARNAQARFRLFSSNVSDARGQPFAHVDRSAIVPVRADGRLLHLGVIALTIDSNRRPWVQYSPQIEAAREQMKQLAGRTDAIVALTHQSLADDQRLVTEITGIDLVLGGHEHENWLLRRGPDFTPIVKADANVRTVAVVTMTFPTPKARPLISARIQVIDEKIQQDAKVRALARRWTELGLDGFRKGGFVPERVVAITTEPLDGRESTVRNGPGRLTDLINNGFAREAGNVDLVLVNSGSIRIDDVIEPGPLTEYDVIRILPFGGREARASLDGALLTSVLDVGVKNRGIGGYLQTRGVTRADDRWLVNGRPIDPTARYTVATTDFLLTGAETNLGFLTASNPGVHDVQYLRDVRMTLIDELRAVYPAR